MKIAKLYNQTPTYLGTKEEVYDRVLGSIKKVSSDDYFKTTRTISVKPSSHANYAKFLGSSPYQYIRTTTPGLMTNVGS